MTSSQHDKYCVWCWEQIQTWHYIILQCYQIWNRYFRPDVQAIFGSHKSCGLAFGTFSEHARCYRWQQSFHLCIPNGQSKNGRKGRRYMLLQLAKELHTICLERLENPTGRHRNLIDLMNSFVGQDLIPRVPSTGRAECQKIQQPVQRSICAQSGRSVQNANRIRIKRCRCDSFVCKPHKNEIAFKSFRC